MQLPTKSEIIFSIKSFVAGMLALYIAMRIGLPRPFWALLTAYVVSQPLSGAVRSKAIYRIAGTFIGAIFAMIVIPRLINYSLLLTISMSVWMGFCLYISLQDRTPKAYVFMLAGYTPALIGIPCLINIDTFNPTTLFDTALARVEEISLGVTCSALIHGRILPQNVGNIILHRMDQALNSARSWMKETFITENAANETDIHKKIAQDISELRLMSTHLPFDTSNIVWTSNAIRTLQDRLSAFLPFMTSIEDRIKLLKQMHPIDIKNNWHNLFEDLIKWASTSNKGATETAHELRRRVQTLTPEINANSSWNDMLKLNLATHLNNLIDNIEASLYQRYQIRLGEKGLFPANDKQLKKVSTRKLHVDNVLALMSAIAAGISLILATLFWIISGWPMGFAAPMMAGMFCCFFATLDDPVPVLKYQLEYTFYSSFITGIYMLWLLPSAHSFEMLMLVMAPHLLICGVYITKPSTMAKAVPLCFTPMASLMMFDMGSADMTSFINSQISQIIGIAIAVFTTGILRTVRSEWVAQRLFNAGKKELSLLAKSKKPQSSIELIVRMTDRVGQLSPRLARLGEKGKNISAEAINDLRTSVNLNALLHARQRLEQRAINIQPLLNELAKHFQKQASDKTSQNDEKTLLFLIDEMLPKLAGTNQFPMRNEAISALVGIRRDMFPSAPDYQPIKLEKNAA